MRKSKFPEDQTAFALNQNEPGTSVDEVYRRMGISAELTALLLALGDDLPLAPRHRNHELGGRWAGYRECHVRSDPLLVYRKTDGDTPRLAHVGSHSEPVGR